MRFNPLLLAIVLEECKYAVESSDSVFTKSYRVSSKICLKYIHE